MPTLVFPVLGEATYIDDFGDARGQGAHEGNDIMAPRRALALAAEAGTVKFHITSSRAGCMLYLNGESGTEYLYIHLNNDLTSENDNQGGCVPGVAFTKGLKSGAKVLAGEPIGYVGDSGDADGIHPHLHFEVHPNGGGAVSPYPVPPQGEAAALRGPSSARPSRSRSQARGDGGRPGRVAEHRPGPLVARRPQDQAGRPEGCGLGSRDGDRSRGSTTAPAGARLLGARAAHKGLPVTIWTAPAKVTLAAQFGAKGSLAASRVVVKPVERARPGSSPSGSRRSRSSARRA